MIDEKTLLRALCELGENVQRQIKVAERDKKEAMFEFALKNQIAMLHNVIRKIKEQPKIGEWIPCSERLPECEPECETDAILFQIKKTGAIETGYFGRGGKYRDSYFRCYRDRMEGVDSSDVIAWKPLPEPYKQKE